MFPSISIVSEGWLWRAQAGSLCHARESQGSSSTASDLANQADWERFAESSAWDLPSQVNADSIQAYNGVSFVPAGCGESGGSDMNCARESQSNLPISRVT